MKTALVQNKPTFQKSGRQTFFVRVAIAETPVFAPSISISGNLYLVDFGHGSPERYHRVNKNKECSCGAQYCDAIEAVRLYLQNGGPRAPDPEGMPPCPICGSRAFRDPVWDGKYTHTLGWRCSQGGLRHFLDAKAERIKNQLAENERRRQIQISQSPKSKGLTWDI